MNKILILILTIAFIAIFSSCPAIDLYSTECDVIANGAYYVPNE